MADADEPQYTTLAERIAALNKNKAFTVNGSPAPKAVRPPPPPPPVRTNSGLSASNGAKQATPAVPARPAKSNPPPLPRRDTQTSLNGQDAVRPPLPSRKSSTQQPPALPQRQPSVQQNGLLDIRRDSTSSEVSQNSTRSSKSTGQSSWSTTSQSSNATNVRKLPPVQSQEAQKPTSTPKLPPRLPSRSNTQDSVTPSLPTRPRIMGFGSPQPSKPVTNGRGSKQTGAAASTQSDEPPPVPTSTRPSAAQIKEVTSRVATTPQALPQDPNNCWTCRDWSAPDAVASQYPRESLPRNDPVGYLAHHLCSPFPSYTDKARAIFAWFHYNIAYDVNAFFGKTVKYHDAESTISRGLAVCGGYSEAYKTIADRAGLECLAITGHCKGFGFTALKEGEPVPPLDPTGHAWNAVSIDGGGWKLIDPCWGAGNVSAETHQFNKVFAPTEFTSPNADFGLRHFPPDPKQQFREDGRTLSWEEYYVGKGTVERVQTYCNTKEEGIKDESMEPSLKKIPVYSGQVTRIQFCKICPHWTSEKHGKGKPPLFVLKIHGQDGRKEDMVPIETDGYWHWLDVNSRDLGAPGQKIEILQITSVDNKDARGITAQQFLAARGKKAMSFSFLAQWDLV